MKTTTSVLVITAACTDADFDRFTTLRPRGADVEPPRVVDISLGALGETPKGVSLLPTIRVRASEALDSVTVDRDSVVLRGPGGGVEIGWTLKGAELGITPAERLRPFTQYSLILAATIRDLHGAPLSNERGEAAPFEYRFITGDAAAGPPDARLVEPAQNAVGVPTNLARMVVRFSEAVSGGAVSFGGVPVDAALSDGGLVALVVLTERLPARRRIQIGLHEFRDSDGEEVFGMPLTFETADGPDERPPEVLPQACSAAEVVVASLCVLPAGDVATIRVAADEAVRIEVATDDGARKLHAASDVSSTSHIVTVTGLEPERSVALTVTVVDLAGNRTTIKGTFESGRPLLPVVISEVYADPLGPEPDQEFVEVVNVGPEPVSLDGLAVADGAGTGDPIVGAGPLAAGGYAVLVASDYSAAGGPDPAPAPGALVVRLQGPLGSNGLLNGGEPVSVVDEDGRVVTIAPNLLAPRAGVSIERTDLAGDPYDASTWDHNPTGSATPGAPNAARR